MKTVNDRGTPVYILNKNDMLTECTHGSCAIIEDSGFYLATHVDHKEARAIHIDPVSTLRDALDLIAERRGLSLAPSR